MYKLLKNTTISPISIPDTGVNIAGGFDYLIPATDYLVWAKSSDVIPYVGNSEIVVNDGFEDLNPSDGMDLIKGNITINFPLAEDVKITNLDILTINTEYSHSLTSDLKQLIIRNRIGATIQYSFVSGESSTNYSSIPSGCTLTLKDLKFSGKTVYIQSNKLSVVEIIELF